MTSSTPNTYLSPIVLQGIFSRTLKDLFKFGRFVSFDIFLESVLMQLQIVLKSQGPRKSLGFSKGFASCLTIFDPSISPSTTITIH